MQSVGMSSFSCPKVFQTMKFMIKIGLVLLQKERRYCASSFVISFFLRRSAVTLAPMGYPHRNPESTAKAPFCETRNRHRKGFPNTPAIKRRPPEDIRRFVITRKGKRVGKMI